MPVSVLAIFRPPIPRCVQNRDRVCMKFRPTGIRRGRLDVHAANRVCQRDRVAVFPGNRLGVHRRRREDLAERPVREGGVGVVRGRRAVDVPGRQRPEGRVHFCGEHTSAWSGWMQGAFESANRVVNEITS